MSLDTARMKVAAEMPGAKEEYAVEWLAWVFRGVLFWGGLWLLVTVLGA